MPQDIRSFREMMWESPGVEGRPAVRIGMYRGYRIPVMLYSAAFHFSSSEVLPVP